MKAYFILGMFVLLFAVTSSAQNKLTGDPKSSSPVEPKQEEVNLSTHRDPYVIQSVGRTYNSRELVRMPTRDINAVANTVPGVQSRAGETPIIGGAAGGTAYYVDGVRVYGALPIINK